MLDLTDQVDLPALRRELALTGRDLRSRSRAVIGALERTAERQQARIAPDLDAMVRTGALESWTPVAIVNRVLVEGRPEAVLKLAGNAEVARVLPDWTSGTVPSGEQEDAPAAASLGERFVSWAVGAMGADVLRSEGLDGTGVVVASIDTGVLEDHEQLVGRRLEGSRGWFDPVSGSTRAADSHGHGTAVLSLAVGGGPGERVVGIAPGARWASALGNYRNVYTRARMTLAADWVLRVARPRVLVNAWSHSEGRCGTFDLPFINAWKAAGIFVVFPAGNAGPRPSSAEAPASLAGTYPDGGPVFSVAGLLASGEVWQASSRGPSLCGASRFPTLAAPGVSIPYALASGPRSYTIGTGTSFAAALVGGAAALLIQADPSLEPDDIERLLVETCRDVPPPGQDDATGSGAIDLASAVERVRARRSASPGRSGPLGSVGQNHGAVGVHAQRDP